MAINGKQIAIGGLILGLVGFTAWYIIRQYKMISDYCYKFWKGKIVSIGLKKVELKLWFVITNKSSIDIQIISQAYKVYVNGSMISNINSSDYISIPAHGNGQFVINVTFNPLQILQVSLFNIGDLLANRENIKIDIEGKATAGSGGIIIKELPIKYSTNLEELASDETDIPASDVEC